MSTVRNAFNKSAKNYEKRAKLQKQIAKNLANKLNYITGDFKTIVDLGAGTGFLGRILSKTLPNSRLISIDFAQLTLGYNNNNICADANNLPLANNSVDMIVSNLMLQWCSNLDSIFSECNRVLKNNGLILISTFGPDTLKELKKSWAVVDDKNHVNNFIDMHNIGDKFLENGFYDPIMEMEEFTLTYQNVIDLLYDIKAIGAQTVKNRPKFLTGKNKFKLMIKMYETYRKQGKIPATYEVIYGHAWKKNNNLGNINLNNQ